MPPDLRFSALPSNPEGVVLVLHGGRERSDRPTSAHQLAVLRMVPLASGIGRVSAGALAVVRLRFSARGWNGDGGGPMQDVSWALAQLAGRFPDVPVGIVGHSMGGRVALRVAGSPRVRVVVALAPWLPPGEPLPELGNRRVVLMHGDRDRTTSARASADMVAALRKRGVPAGFVLVAREGHAMLRRPKIWRDVSSSLICASLLRGWQPTGPAATLIGGAATVAV